MLRRLLALLLLAGCATAQPPLAQKIDALTAQFSHSLWGIDVEDEEGRHLYQKNARSLFIPASTSVYRVRMKVAGNRLGYMH